MSRRGRRGLGSRLRLSRVVVVRFVPIALFALVALWLTVAVSGANVVREIRPDLALRLMPFDGRAKARSAERASATLQDQPDQLGQVERSATEALLRDPTIASAWRTLGLTAAMRNRGERAARLFRTAERFSRRDTPTQLWLIEEAVTRDDIPAALHHYDVALSTSRSNHTVLLPILVSALTTDAIVRDLAPLLRSQPPWQEAFYRALLDRPPPGSNFLRLLVIVRGSPGAPDPALMGQLVSKLVDMQRFDHALVLYRYLRGTSALELVRNGDFERENRLPPFDWLLEQRADLNADQRAEPGRGRGASLHAYAASGAGGSAASQLLVLPPGAYAFSARSGASDGIRPARLSWTIGCAHGGPAVLLSVPAPTASGAGTAAAGTVRIPPGCTAQRLSLMVAADFEPQGVGGWVDDVVLRGP